MGAVNLTPVYTALCRAGLAHPGWYMPVTQYSPHAYVGAGGPFGAFRFAPILAAALPQ